MGRLVVGVQGTTSLTTLAWAADHAHREGAEVVAVHVMAPAWDVAELPICGFSLADDFAAALEMLEREWCGVFRVRGVRYRAEVVLGAVLPSLCAVARRERASLLVIGRPRRRLFLTGVAGLVAKAPCSVAFVTGADTLVAEACGPAVANLSDLARR